MQREARRLCAEDSYPAHDSTKQVRVSSQSGGPTFDLPASAPEQGIFQLEFLFKDFYKVLEKTALADSSIAAANP